MYKINTIMLVYLLNTPFVVLYFRIYYTTYWNVNKNCDTVTPYSWMGEG